MPTVTSFEWQILVWKNVQHGSLGTLSFDSKNFS